jgi:hypothetical protein
MSGIYFEVSVKNITFAPHLTQNALVNSEPTGKEVWVSG